MFYILLTQEAQAQCRMFLVVSNQVIKSVLSFAVYRFAVHPEFQDRVRTEILNHDANMVGTRVDKNITFYCSTQ